MTSMSNYWVTSEPLRQHPSHGFTVKSLLDRRFKENTSGAILALYWLTPFMQRLDQQVRVLADKDSEPTSEDLPPLLIESAVHATTNFAVFIGKVTVTTSLCAMLIERDTPVSHSIVYHTDMYPRLHQKYIGDLLQGLWLPRSLASVMGPKTRPEDVQVFTEPASSVAVAQDSFKRHVLVTAANFTVSSGVSIIQFAARPANKKGAAVKQQGDARALCTRLVWNFIEQTQSLVGTMLGAVVGRAVGGPVGEYWGEYIGPTVTGLSVMSFIYVSKRLQQKDSKKGGAQ